MGWFDVVANVATGGVYGAVTSAVDGDVGGAFANLATGGLYGAVTEAIGSGSESSVSYGAAPDYSDAMVAMSDNNKQVALAQIQSQEMQMQQAAMDREMQLAANLELSFEKFDTKLQVAKLDYFQQMTAEENRHVERIATLQSGHTSGPALPDSDLPPPSEEF